MWHATLLAAAKPTVTAARAAARAAATARRPRGEWTGRKKWRARKKQCAPVVVHVVHGHVAHLGHRVPEDRARHSNAPEAEKSHARTTHACACACACGMCACACACACAHAYQQMFLSKRFLSDMFLSERLARAAAGDAQAEVAAEQRAA